MRFVSFFAGIGGFDLGLERAGHECVGQVEIDPYALRVLARHWPTVPRFGDVRTLAPDDIPAAELWAGGFPCSDISVAGKRAGISGSQSYLWFELARLVRSVRPKFLFVENTPSLTLRGLDAVIGDLSALGYDTEWHCVPAAAVGAPHLRARLWILAYPVGYSDGPLFDAVQAGWVEAECRPWWACEPGIQRVADGPASRMDLDREGRCGYAVVPQVVEAIARRVWG